MINPKSCDFCGQLREAKDLIDDGNCRICFLCSINQTNKPRGKVVKTKYGIRDNSALS